MGIFTQSRHLFSMYIMYTNYTMYELFENIKIVPHLIVL